jgi:hypothetical protein
VSTPVVILIVLFVAVELIGTGAVVWALRDVEAHTDEEFAAAGEDRQRWRRRLTMSLGVLLGVGGLAVAAWYVLGVRRRVVSA